MGRTSPQDLVQALRTASSFCQAPSRHHRVEDQEELGVELAGCAAAALEVNGHGVELQLVDVSLHLIAK